MTRDPILDVTLDGGRDYELEVRQAENAYGLIEQLRDRRVSLGLSQAAVADRMSRNQSVVSTLERLGSDPRWSSVRRYASALGVLIEYDLTPADDLAVARAATSGMREDTGDVDVARVAQTILAAR